MKKFRKTAISLICAAIVLSFTACGSSGYSPSYNKAYDSASSAAPAYAYGDYESYDGDYGYNEEFAVADGSGSNSGSSSSSTPKVNDTSRKLIKTYNMTVETEDFNGFTDAITKKVTELDGYIENMDTSNGSVYSSYYQSKRSSMTIRIPADRADDFINMIGEKGNITYQSLNVNDITLQYVDIESRKSAYETEEKRVLELLDRAETLEEILILEDKLSEIRYQLESIESQLRTFDNKIDYSTIYLEINEVKVYTEPVVEPETYGERLANAFTRNVKSVYEVLKDFLVGFVGAIPSLVILAIVVLIIVLIIRGIVKSTDKRAKRKAEKRMKEWQEQQLKLKAQAEAEAKAQAEAQAKAKKAEEKAGENAEVKEESNPDNGQ